MGCRSSPLRRHCHTWRIHEFSLCRNIGPPRHLGFVSGRWKELAIELTTAAAGVEEWLGRNGVMGLAFLPYKAINAMKGVRYIKLTCAIGLMLEIVVTGEVDDRWRIFVALWACRRR
jgi:hypothetical protein